MATNWPRPMNISKVGSFLDLANNYRRFVWGFSGIAMATTQLLQIDKKIMWDDKCEASLTEFKTRLTTTPIFTLPSDMEGFIIYSNVSLKELECVLIQHEKVVAHTFRQLRLYEKNYTIHNLEFIVVVFALKI